MCLYPKLIINKKYTITKKNKGVVPPILDERVKFVPVGCGQCMECKKQKAREWQVRLQEDIRHYKNGKFITLTFSNESITELSKERVLKDLESYELDNGIAKLATRRFLERWRKKYKKSVRHWLVTELGHQGTENIHLHGIIWTDETKDEIEKHWQYGMIWAGTFVNEKTINYIIKYIHKTDEQHKYYKSKVLTTAGIGAGYLTRQDSKLNRYNGDKTNEAYTTRSGHKLSLPIYWRNKIYKEEEREKLWLTKLDEQVRYVNGIPIDISQTEEQYYKVLKRAREQNIKLGYSDGNTDWKQKTYENERRKLKHAERLAKGKSTS